MLSKIFLGMSLIGAEWVLYLLLLLSVISVALMFERARFYREATRGLSQFRAQLRQALSDGKWEEAIKAAEERQKSRKAETPDLESGLATALLGARKASGKPSAAVLNELAQDSVVRARIHWDQNLALLATIGSNAPFIGLFGTVLGIMKAFHDLSQQAAAGGVQTVTSGISEALVATAVGILVAIPAVVAFNLYQRKVKSAMSEAEALKSFLIGKLAE